ncbi:MAG: sigma 54-interacting transcriptional regulator [Myxococcales bacterium]|nr:sigma 54-interacting transcriptional regulator [Myxococcales bacterium]
MVNNEQPSRWSISWLGTRRNARALGADRATLRAAATPGLGGLRGHIVLTSQAAPSTEARADADALVASLKEGPPRAKCLKIEVPDAEPGAVDLKTLEMRVYEALEANEKSLQGDARRLTLAVSTLTGTAEQLAALFGALDRRGQPVEVVYERGKSLERWQPSRGPEDSEQRLEGLGAAPGAWTVLLTGETGVGKTEAALRLHHAWARNFKRRGRFEAINLAAIPRELIEAELFGYVAGAFTGAAKASPGLLRSAEMGTAFLDEIGDLSLDLQSRLLKVFDRSPDPRKRLVRPIGGEEESVDLRMIFGTHRALMRRVDEGQFRDDLYGRIATHEVELPPLRAVRQRIFPAMVLNLERAAGAYKLQTGYAVRFTWQAQARARMLAFCLDPHTAWRWNYRDAAQAAERLALAAWGALDPGSRRRPNERLDVQISQEVVEAECTRLEARWRQLEGASPGPDASPAGPGGSYRRPDAAPVDEALTAEGRDTLSQVERLELALLLDAQRRTSSFAEAWRLLVEARAVPGWDAKRQNASQAFRARLERYKPWLKITKA